MRQNQDTQKRSNLKSFIIIGLLLLLVAVIGFGGYTLSKYLTSKRETGKANVAKWGFEITTDATNLFGESYKWDNTNSVVGTDGTITIKASTAKQNVVAPGATGSMTIKVGGTSEVRAKMTMKLEGNDIALNYTKDGAATTYAPVVWTLNDGTSNIVTDDTFAKLQEELGKIADTYEVNTAATKTYTISWKWAFHVDDATDVLDTTLGMIANGSTGVEINGVTVTDSKTTIIFNLTVTVEQIQG